MCVIETFCDYPLRKAVLVASCVLFLVFLLFPLANELAKGVDEEDLPYEQGHKVKKIEIVFYICYVILFAIFTILLILFTLMNLVNGVLPTIIGLIATFYSGFILYFFRSIMIDDLIAVVVLTMVFVITPFHWVLVYSYYVHLRTEE